IRTPDASRGPGRPRCRIRDNSTGWPTSWPERRPGAMKIGVLGGGPAGLYLALLMKKADPSHDVVVVERNAPDATFGWGVVFSEETLGTLRDADHESYLSITDSFARWDTIDVHYRGEVVRSGGHAFSGVARKTLLEILQARCRELAVELTFHE